MPFFIGLTRAFIFQLFDSFANMDVVKDDIWSNKSKLLVTLSSTKIAKNKTKKVFDKLL